jgi:putative holliday junction resolvase
MGRIMAIDYGQKRTGLAVTDEGKMIASPLETVPTGEIFAYLKKYTEANPVECFVVGEPRQMDNTPSESAKYIDPFVKKLQKEFREIPVKRADERFTSLIAMQTIRNSGLKKMDRRDKSRIDSISAALILQSFLESKEMKG